MTGWTSPIAKIALAALAVIVLAGLFAAYATPLMTLALDSLSYCF